LAPGLGIEPRLTESKSVVLPLHNPGTKKQDRIKLVLPLHQTFRIRSRTVPLLLQSIVVYCLLWLSLNWYPESDSNRHFTVSKTADSTRLAYRGIIWCNLEESNLFQRCFKPPLWPHQLKLHYTWSPMKDSNLRSPRSKQGGLAASLMRDKIIWGERGNRTLAYCFTDSSATTTLLTPLIGSSYKVWTCDLHDVNVLLYHWAKELYVGVPTRTRT
jgi:hypothetical protein